MEVADLKLLKNKVMLVLALFSFLGSFPYYVPVMFSMNRAVQYGVPKEDVAFLLSVYG